MSLAPSQSKRPVAGDTKLLGCVHARLPSDMAERLPAPWLLTGGHPCVSGHNAGMRCFLLPPVRLQQSFLLDHEVPPSLLLKSCSCQVSTGANLGEENKFHIFCIKPSVKKKQRPYHYFQNIESRELKSLSSKTVLSTYNLINVKNSRAMLRLRLTPAT